MEQIMDWFSSWASALTRITVTNAIEILIIAVLVYQALKWIKNTKAWVLLRGILIILAFTLVCEILQLDTILWILGKIATIAAMALIIVFQPELRKALENLGQSKLLNIPGSDKNKNGGMNEKTVNEIARAAFELSKTKTGALVVIEADDSLSEIERTGIAIDGKVSSQLLINIFEHNTPLHDGAVVVRDNTITAATCYLPLSDNMYISKALGTRHRAAIGISEVTDSLTVVVSEETGAVSLVEKGTLKKMTDINELKHSLHKLIPEESQKTIFKAWRERKKEG